MSGQRILIIEDDRNLRKALHQIMQGEGYSVESAESGELGLACLKSADFDLVITDLKLPGIDGLEVLKAVRSTRPDTSLLVVTAYASVDSAVRAMKEGAEDYVSKPFNIDEICLAVARIFEKRDLLANNALLRDQLRKKYDFENFVGQSEPMIEVFKTINKIKDSRSSVMIFGETGTGKELVARAIHFNSVRSDRPFIPVNCGALNENLLESELFGHAKGSFTGAIRDKQGLFEAAEGGTIFLDEVGDVGKGLQQVLLRVLEEREIQPVGSTERRKVDVRVISATNKDLEAMSRSGEFREDLYYRLNVIGINLPPLRSRRDDVARIALHFLEKYAAENGKKLAGFEPEAMAALEHYDWPGNVRELENVVQRAVLLESGPRITPDSFPMKITHAPAPQSSEHSQSDLRSLENVGKAYIMEILRKTGGNKAWAAEILGINRTTLWRMMKRLELNGDQGRGAADDEPEGGLASARTPI